MKKLKSFSAGAAALVAAAVVASEPAFAGNTVPGPVVGAGLPALAVIAGGYYLIRRFRRA